MSVARWSWMAAFLLLLAGTPLCAQVSNQPHVGYVFPGGGCRGTTFEVVVGGQHIKEVTEAYISGGGIQAKIVKWYRPMTQGEYVGLNMKISVFIEEAEKKGRKVTREMAIKELGITEEQLKEMEIYRKRDADPKRQPNPQIAEELTIQIRIAPDAALGDRELRLLTDTAMSNPLWFYVGQWPEISEKEPNDHEPEPSVYIKLPMVINGQVMPGDADRFGFEAKKGMKLVAQCAARELIPYLADAVPGWFQAVLHLYDDRGQEVAFADSLGFRHDPVLYYEVPKDGKYVLEIHDSIYRGREDFTYRISLGEIPYITGLFPLGGKAGTPCNVEVKGWNLPVESTRIEPTFYRGWMLRPVTVEKDKIVSNRVGFIVDTLREVVEREGNDTPDEAQEVGSSVAINGRIDKPGDVDYFKIDGSGVVLAEVFARRLYSPLDSVLCLTDRRGKAVVYNDDYEDKSWPLITHHADSRILSTGKGAQYLSIGDAQGRGGPEFVYRLYIRPPRPDFDLRVTPSSVTARPGSHVPITVHAIRKDGFDEDIALGLDGAPKGFGLSGAWVPGKSNKIRLTLQVPPAASREPYTLQLVGHSMSRGKSISRPAFPAEAWTQAFILEHVVPTKDWTIFVSGGAAGHPPCRSVDSIVQLAAGKTGQARFLVDQGRNPKELKFELSEPPDGITLEDPVPVAIPPGILLPVKCDAEKVKPGTKGNLLLIVSQETTTVSTDDKKPQTSKYVIGMMPALPFEVSTKPAVKAPAKPAAKGAAKTAPAKRP